jgi:hypothetical protein
LKPYKESAKPNNDFAAIMSCPKQVLLAAQVKTKTRGRKCKPEPANLTGLHPLPKKHQTNWLEAHLAQQIIDASVTIKDMSPKIIADFLQSKHPQHFSKIQPAVIGAYQDVEGLGRAQSRKWGKRILNAVASSGGLVPGDQST